MNTTSDVIGAVSGVTVRSSGSQGEQLLQSAYDTAERAGRSWEDSARELTPDFTLDQVDIFPSGNRTCRCD